LRSKKFKVSSADGEEITTEQKLENRGKRFKLDETVDNGKKRKISEVASTDEQERSLDRLQRFGAPIQKAGVSEEVKKKRRTDKFNVTKTANVDKNKKRLNKFNLEKKGLTVNS